jgi:hypothetical protein
MDNGDMRLGIADHLGWAIAVTASARRPSTTAQGHRCELESGDAGRPRRASAAASRGVDPPLTGARARWSWATLRRRRWPEMSQRRAWRKSVRSGRPPPFSRSRIERCAQRGSAPHGLHRATSRVSEELAPRDAARRGDDPLRRRNPYPPRCGAARAMRARPETRTESLCSPSPNS